MSSLYIENENSYYLLYDHQHGYLDIRKHKNMKAVNACIKRNESPPIIYETIYKDHFINKVFNILEKLFNLDLYKKIDDQLLNSLCLHYKTRLATILFCKIGYYQFYKKK